MTTEYHIVIACPPTWEAHMADGLLTRLRDFELPSTVGLYLWRLEDGKIAAQTVVRETGGRDDDE